MSNRFSAIALATTSAALMLALTACSGTADSDTAAAAPAASTPTASTLAGGDGVLTIATSGTFRPITFSEGGTLTGYDIEVGTHIAEELGLEVEFVAGQLAGLLPGMNSGRFDAVMSGLTMTEERKKAITFSEPYLADGAVAATAAGNTEVSGVTDLTGMKVGVIGGSGTEDDIIALGGYASLTAYPSAPEGFADVGAERIDLFAVGRIATEDYIKNAPDGDKIKIAGDVYGIKPAGIGLPADDTELKPLIDDIVNEMWEDGSLQELQQKWFGFTIDREDTRP